MTDWKVLVNVNDINVDVEFTVENSDAHDFEVRFPRDAFHALVEKVAAEHVSFLDKQSGKEKELTNLKNQVASYAQLLEIEKKKVDQSDSYIRRERAAAELTYQKIIDQLVEKLAACDRYHDD